MWLQCWEMFCFSQGISISAIYHPSILVELLSPANTFFLSLLAGSEEAIHSQGKKTEKTFVLDV